MTRKSKIARLPREIREQLNRRLDDGEPQNNLVEWLNSLPEAQTVLRTEFDDRPINEQNLSEWKQGGFRDWLFQQEAIELVREMDGEADELNEASKVRLTDLLAHQLAARYVIAARSLRRNSLDEQGTAADPAALEREHKRLRELCGDIVALRKGDHVAKGLDLERERLGLLESELEVKRQDKIEAGLDSLVEATKNNPKAVAAYWVFRKECTGEEKESAAPSESNQIKPNQTSGAGS